jgi:phosphatidylserine/phosphatidylglycerophosphate/cardiolipin synthase-like enzyme
MPTKRFVETALAIRNQSPASIWEGTCAALSSAQDRETRDQILSKLPSSANSDVDFLIGSLISEHEKNMTWREIGLCLTSIGETTDILNDEGKPEIIWSGPSTEIIPVRRIDQVLYDLITNAQQHILLVTFAAAKIGLLSDSLFAATERGVKVDLVLESETESEGQLSVDARSAFSAKLVERATMYYWPISKRERNEWGKPGKLHAKCAVIDDAAIISSANLTGDAFNRNMELGILFRGGSIPTNLIQHFRSLIASGTLIAPV